MEEGVVGTQMTDVLHVISQGLLVPVVIILIAFIAYALFCIGTLIFEGVRERRDFKDHMPEFLDTLMQADGDDIPGIIKDSALLNRQKIALLKVYDYRRLPGDALISLIRRLVNKEDTHYKRIMSRNNLAAKISPMVGLMGTLIPLGPGIAAMGFGDTEALSSSLLIAFDTTVAGLVVAAICLACGKLRQAWYGDYMSALDSAMATMLEKIELMRAEGLITGDEPTDFAQRFEEGLTKDKKPSPAPAVKADSESDATKDAPKSYKEVEGAAETAVEAALVETAEAAETVAKAVED